MARSSTEIDFLPFVRTLSLLTLALGLAAPIVLFFGGDSQFDRLIGVLGAAFLLPAAGFLSAWLTAAARARTSASIALPSERSAATYEAEARASAERWTGGWLPILWTLLLGGVALASVTGIWSGPASPLPAGLAQACAGVLLVVAFGLLVVERHYSHLEEAGNVEAGRLARLCRVPLLIGLALAAFGVLSSIDMQWSRLILQGAALVTGLVAVEILLRSIAQAFTPFPPIQERVARVDSWLCMLLAWPRAGRSGVNAALAQQFGIDLSRSWALSFVRRASLPLLLGMTIVAWLLSGLTSLSLNQRAVYERLGVPVRVFGPGLHVHLPWPFGILRKTELGVVHDIPIVLSRKLAPFGGMGEVVPEGAAPERAAAEALPTPAEDRLWTGVHPSEASYLIASEANGSQNVQIVDVDLRVVYRLGASDAAAMAAVYGVEDPEGLVRGLAGRILVRHFAQRTLPELLGQNRDAFVSDFHDELQAQLDGLSSGLEVVGVVVEAIHPPAQAAPAYYNVQAAEIRASAQISESEGNAIRTLSAAEQNGTDLRNTTQAEAAERVELARATQILFDGDRLAYERAGKVFLFERWLSRLGESLRSATLLIVDHRLIGDDAPTIDLRQLGGAVDMGVIRGNG